MKYRVLVGIDYPTAPSVIRKLLAGEDIPWGARGNVHREPGDVVDDLPAVTVAAGLEHGWIEEIADDVP